MRTILAILFFKVGLCCITSGNLIACEYSRDMIFYNYSIKPFSFFGAESFTFIATIKYCWRLLHSSDTEQCWPVVYNDWIFLNLSSSKITQTGSPNWPKQTSDIEKKKIHFLICVSLQNFLLLICSSRSEKRNWDGRPGSHSVSNSKKNLQFVLHKEMCLIWTD